MKISNKTYSVKLGYSPFREGEVNMIKSGGVGKPMAMYVRKTRNGETVLTTLKKTWIGQIIQVFIFRCKDR